MAEKMSHLHLEEINEYSPFCQVVIFILLGEVCEHKLNFHFLMTIFRCHDMYSFSVNGVPVCFILE